MNAIGHGFCVDCESTVPLTQFGKCQLCGGGSIVPRKRFEPLEREPEPALVNYNIDSEETA